MPGRADSSKFSLARSPFIPELQRKLVVTLLTSEIWGISSLRGMSWKWRGRGGQGNAFLDFWVIYCLFSPSLQFFPHPLLISNSS